MVELDEQQERVLRNLADIVGRIVAQRHLRLLRAIARFGLTTWKTLRPRHFENWNSARIAQQGRA